MSAPGRLVGRVAAGSLGRRFGRTLAVMLSPSSRFAVEPRALAASRSSSLSSLSPLSSSSSSSSSPACRRGTLVLALLGGMAACGAPRAKEPVMSPPTSDASSSSPASSPSGGGAAAAAPRARSRADLLQHEGKPIRVEGVYRFPVEQAFARNKLVLDDGTEVILPRPSSGPGAAELVAANSGARLVVSGVVYVGAIPERYGIKGRTPDPYLFELTAVELLP